MKLNRRIRELRTMYKMTEKDFSKIFNISESSVSLYESGKRKPSIDLILKIADYFNVSTDYLLGKTDNPLKNDYDDDLKIDFAKHMENVIYLIDKSENPVFRGIEMNEQFKVIFKKTILDVFNTLLLFSNSLNK